SCSVSVPAIAAPRRSTSSAARALVTAIVLGAAAAVGAPSLRDQPAWPDTFVSRLEALALLQTLHGEILSSTSATATLETWCDEHAIAPAARIGARLNRGEAPAANADQRRRLPAR